MHLQQQQQQQQQQPVLQPGFRNGAGVSPSTMAVRLTQAPLARAARRFSQSLGDSRTAELEETQTIQAGIFAIFHALLGRRYDNSKRLACLRLALEFLQVFTLIVSPHFHWAIDTKLW
jgi:hypothetical protein